MRKVSRVGQRFPIREEPLPPIPEDSSTIRSASSERALRLERRTVRRLQEAQDELLDMTTTTTTSTMVTTPVIRPFTAHRDRILRTSQEPEELDQPPRSPPRPSPNPPSPPGGPDGPGDPDGPDDPQDPEDGDHGPDGGDDEDSDIGLTKKQLADAILALSREKKPAEVKTTCKTREPDTFNGTEKKLRPFIFQCKVYFKSRPKDFEKEETKIFFAISFLTGAALDYFEPYINEPDPDKEYNFLCSWEAFVQKLTNLFGPYKPQEDDEDAIVALTFPSNMKATNYFIEFAKYQSRIN